MLGTSELKDTCYAGEGCDSRHVVDNNKVLVSRERGCGCICWHDKAYFSFQIGSSRYVSLRSN